MPDKGMFFLAGFRIVNMNQLITSNGGDSAAVPVDGDPYDHFVGFRIFPDQFGGPGLDVPETDGAVISSADERFAFAMECNAVDISLMRLMKLPLFLPDLKQADPAVITCGSDEFAVRGEGGGMNGVRVAIKCLNRIAVFRLPEFDGIVETAGGNS